MRLLAVLALCASGCVFAAAYSTKDRFLQVAREFNEDVRWGRIDEASQKMSGDMRQRFYDRHKILEDELEIADQEMVALEIDKSDKKLTRANVKVEWTWSLKRRGIVERTTTKQAWEERGSTWVLV